MRFSISREAAIAAASIAIAGCASTQLNYNTLDLASSSQDLLTSQVLFNLGKFRSSPYAIPSQVSIPSGSATTTNSITPTIGGPVGVQSTGTLANSAVAPAFFATTRTNVAPNGTFTASFGDQWSQNWTLTPLEDPDQLRRLRALYQFGAGWSDRKVFGCAYPLVQKAQSSGSMSSTPVNVYVNGANSSSKSNSQKSATNQTYIYSGKMAKACAYVTVQGSPDPAFLKPPGCIICDYTVELPPSDEPTKIQFTGTVSSEKATVGKIDKDLDLKVVGSPITGLCIPGSTIVKAKNADGSIVLSEHPTCDIEKTILTVSVTPVSPKSTPHVLQVNPSLSNEWLWKPNTGLPFPPDSKLGNYAGLDLYLTPDPESRQKFSDFVLFVLEATLQSTSSQGGAASGKGTPQKAGGPASLQLPAQPQNLLILQ
ncbi:MAG: hypothetical protein ABSA68_15410 [Xanthobacteraceae bacterium]|jgi:hypothetical protein